MINIPTLRRATVLIAAALFLPLAAFAQDPATEDVVQTTILPGWRAADGSHMFGIKMSLAPGWNTYWRSPGDTGIPPQFDWQGSRNIAAVRVLWPRPVVSEKYGLQTIGYTGEFVWPVEIQPRDPSKDVRLEGRMDIGVCKDICLPVSLTFAARLPANETAETAEIRAALNNRPATAREAGVTKVTCAISPISDGLQVTAQISMPNVGAPEVIVFELPNRQIWVSAATVKRRGGTLIATADMVPPDGTAFLLNRSELRISVLGTRKMVDIKGCTAG